MTEIAAARAAVSTPVKLAYGLGQLVEGVSTTVYGTFLFFLYTALLGLPGSLVGAATGIALVVDAVADPMLGSWSDNTRSRWGRRIPFMAIGAPIVALGIGLAFSPPHGLRTMALFAWLLAISLILRFAVSVFNLPFVALGAELSEDYAERSSIVAWRALSWLSSSPMASSSPGHMDFSIAPATCRSPGLAPLSCSSAAWSRRSASSASPPPCPPVRATTRRSISASSAR
jgi:Na+/melibiose symporter-like transporter